MSETGKTPEKIVEAVRSRYAKIATGEQAGCGCACNDTESESAVAQGVGYAAEEIAALPEGANLGLGCGAPIGYLVLEPGETVVDLGSGGGIDAFLAARLVGPTGHVIGVDMTPEMLERARAAAARHGLTQVEFRAGRLEELPIEDGTADAITSNCVINLVPDKKAVFREAARVLRPGGRMVVSDIILDRDLPAPLAGDLLAWTGCVSGAAPRATYLADLAEAGFTGLEILHEIDYAAKMAEAAPGEATALLDRLGLTIEDIRGAVTSVTYRVRKAVAGEQGFPSPSSRG